MTHLSGAPGAPSIESMLAFWNAFPAPPRQSLDRRQYGRRRLDARVRYLTDDGAEHEGIAEDVAPGGLSVRAPNPPPVGKRIVAYIDEIGRFEGNIIRSTEEGFAIALNLRAGKLLRLAKAIERYFAEASDDVVYIDRRSHERAVGDQDELFGETKNGDRFRCSVVNISLGGVEIATPVHLDLGEDVKIGAVQGVVVRRTAQGYAIRRVLS